MNFPIIPHIPMKKSLEVLEFYQEHGPQFGKVLYSMYQDVKVGNNIDLEKQFIELCSDYMPVEIKSPDNFWRTFPFTYQKNYLTKKFGHAICVSTNDEVAHGSPGRHKIKYGDIVSVDCGLAVPFKSNYIHFDAAFTTVIQQEDTWTIEPLNALRNIASGNPKNTSDVAKIIQEKARIAHQSQVVSLTGHGIGFGLHEAPVIHNACGDFLSVELFEGLCFCAEPIFADPSYNLSEPSSSFITPVFIGEDGWMVSTSTGISTSHFETVFGVIDGQIVDLIGVTTWDL